MLFALQVYLFLLIQFNILYEIWPRGVRKHFGKHFIADCRRHFLFPQDIQKPYIMHVFPSLNYRFWRIKHRDPFNSDHEQDFSKWDSAHEKRHEWESFRCLYPFDFYFWIYESPQSELANVAKDQFTQLRRKELQFLNKFILESWLPEFFRTCVVWNIAACYLKGEESKA